MCPLGKGVRGIGTGQQMPGRSCRAWKATAAMESPQALIAPLERGSGGFNKSSSDDRPGPGICGSKYVEDAKAARSVRVWDRVPMKNKVGGIKKLTRGASGSAQRPNTKKRESSDERLKTLPKNGGFLLSHLVWQYHRR